MLPISQRFLYVCEEIVPLNKNEQDKLARDPWRVSNITLWIPIMGVGPSTFYIRPCNRANVKGLINLTNMVMYMHARLIQYFL